MGLSSWPGTAKHCQIMMTPCEPPQVATGVDTRGRLMPIESYFQTQSLTANQTVSSISRSEEQGYYLVIMDDEIAELCKGLREEQHRREEEQRNAKKPRLARWKNKADANGLKNWRKTSQPQALQPYLGLCHSLNLSIQVLIHRFRVRLIHKRRRPCRVVSR